MPRPVRTLLPALLIAALLTGCVPADPLGPAAREVLESLEALDPADREAAVITIAAREELAAWSEWGVDPSGVPGALATLSDWVLAEREAPHEMQLASLSASATDIGSAFGIGFVAIGSLGKSGVEYSNEGARGTDTTGTPGGSATVSVGADGTVSTTYTAGGAEGGLSVDISAASEIQPCPDADGVVELSAEVSVRVGVGSAGGSIELEVETTGRLDETAALASSEYSYRQQHSSTADGTGEFLDHSGNSAGQVTVNRWSSKATAEFAKGAAEMAASLAYLVSHDLLAAAETGWTSGRCVDVTLTPSEDPGSLEPEANITIDADAHARLDGQATGGTLFPTLSGEGDLGSDGSRVPAPATFDYRAADEEGRTGVLTVESRSIRGVGRASIPLTTGGGAYIADVTVDEYTAHDTICSLTEPFEITGSGLTFSFTPAGEGSGTFRMSGARYDLTFVGDGDYSVSHDADGVATALHASGDSTLTTPDGITADSPVDLQYTLTPTEPCE
ncbi:hypothetical protein [Antiquaquibacter soli]|uniref:Lipoprotein n=1 Tax=Antiquaquibacter soli TaxID=3064523 RepID=A0ABT9BN55_9MICO|nr:hypothetical protein [Protaetiibacter sp. WY-16]MDO7881216.1 hypothetical protein [Protaetiibacter sp. WY-16]